jgi:hypothetical protein
MQLRRIIDGMRFRFWLFRDRLRDLFQGKAHRTAVFRRIFSGNLWGDPESASGPGSGPAATENVRRELPELFRRFEVRTLLDSPCGDFMMRDVAKTLDRYIGVDIVPDLIQRHSATFGSETISFLCADIAADPLPQTDAILCRDCFIHLPTRMIRAALRNFRSTGARYLFLSSDHEALPYHNIAIGSFRVIDFTQPPFCFPTPIATIREDAKGSRQLCMWKLSELPIDGIE